MKRVNRTEIPSSLRNNSVKWTKDLFHEIGRVGSFSKVSNTLKNKYRQKDVQQALEKMYYGKCCYCEQTIGAESYEHIEHLRPKSKKDFHHLVFEWKNLHWCCQKCNMAKGDQWDYSNPILDPTVDEPESHLSMNLINGELIPLDARGVTTITHTQLNREKLVKARKRTLNKLQQLELMVKNTPEQKDDLLLLSLLDMYIEDDEEFSSLVFQYVKKIRQSME